MKNALIVRKKKPQKLVIFVEMIYVKNALRNISIVLLVAAQELLIGMYFGTKPVNWIIYTDSQQESRKNVCADVVRNPDWRYRIMLGSTYSRFKTEDCSVCKLPFEDVMPCDFCTACACMDDFQQVWKECPQCGCIGCRCHFDEGGMYCNECYLDKN